MGVSCEVGDSICMVFLQVFDSKIGVVCCAFIWCLCSHGFPIFDTMFPSHFMKDQEDGRFTNCFPRNQT